MGKLLTATDSQLLAVDIQERLAPAMSDLPDLLSAVEKLIRCARLLGVPATISEQYPKGLGPTLSAVREACGADPRIFAKMHFSCARDQALAEHIRSAARRQIVLCGIEAHVCVLQTAMDLQAQGFDVFVVVDAIASRKPASKDIALRRLAAAGVALVTTEMAAFEWLERAGDDRFKAVSPLLR